MADPVCYRCGLSSGYVKPYDDVRHVHTDASDCIAQLCEQRDAALAREAALRGHHANHECDECGSADCRGAEPLHYHHDGCPYEYALEKERDAARAELDRVRAEHEAVLLMLRDERDFARLGCEHITNEYDELRAELDRLRAECGAMREAIEVWRDYDPGVRAACICADERPACLVHGERGLLTALSGAATAAYAARVKALEEVARVGRKYLNDDDTDAVSYANRFIVEMRDALAAFAATTVKP